MFVSGNFNKYLVLFFYNVKRIDDVAEINVITNTQASEEITHMHTRTRFNPFQLANLVEHQLEESQHFREKTNSNV